MTEKAQDFSGQDLRGRDFAKQHLRGAKFVNANLEGANFKNANLFGAIEIKKDYMTIYINLDYNKTEQDAIETIAHELTHASGGTGHDREFFMREEEAKSKLMKKFYPEK